MVRNQQSPIRVLGRGRSNVANPLLSLIEVGNIPRLDEMGGGSDKAVYYVVNQAVEVISQYFLPPKAVAMVLYCFSGYLHSQEWEGPKLTN